MSWTGDAQGAGFTTGRPYRVLAANAGAMNVRAAERDPSSLLNAYRRLIQLRRSRPSIEQGRVVQSVAQGSVLWTLREHRGEMSLVAYNFGKVDATWAAPSAAVGHTWKRVAGSADVSAPQVGGALPARSWQVFELVR
jgi:glycosidase